MKNDFLLEFWKNHETTIFQTIFYANADLLVGKMTYQTLVYLADSVGYTLNINTFGAAFGNHKHPQNNAIATNTMCYGQNGRYIRSILRTIHTYSVIQFLMIFSKFYKNCKSYDFETLSIFMKIT